MSFCVRKAVVEDAQAVGLVHEQAWRETYTRLLPPWMFAARSAEKSAAMFRRQGCRDMLVAEAEEGVVGFCASAVRGMRGFRPPLGKCTACMC